MGGETHTSRPPFFPAARLTLHERYVIKEANNREMNADKLYLVYFHTKLLDFRWVLRFSLNSFCFLLCVFRGNARLTFSSSSLFFANDETQRARV